MIKKYVILNHENGEFDILFYKKDVDRKIQDLVDEDEVDPENLSIMYGEGMDIKETEVTRKMYSIIPKEVKTLPIPPLSKI